MHSALQDVRYATRVLRRSPGFTLMTVAVLAIAIGANSAIFSLVNAVLLRPLPYSHPEQLVRLWEKPPSSDHNTVAPLNFVDWNEQNHTFAGMFAISGGPKTLTRPNTAPERIPGESATYNLFDLLGVRPVAGRTFTADDARTRAKVVVISERLWRTRFGANPGLLGQSLTLDGELYTVIGIAPASFQVLWPSDVWSVYTPRRGPEQRRMHYLRVIGRLKPSVTMEQARADLGVIAKNIERISPETNKNWGVTVETLHQSLVGRELRVTSLVLAGVVAFVLLMACANVANLLLTRAVGRTREIALRASLGGSRLRIVQQLLTESALLSGLGGVAGIGLAYLVIQTAPAFLPAGTLPVAVTLSLDGNVLAFAVAVTAATGLLFGLAPAWQGARISLSDTLRAGGRTLAGGSRTAHAALAAGEIAIAVLLVAGAGLLLRTLNSLVHVDPGFRAENVLTLTISLPNQRYETPELASEFYKAARREIAAIPGVRAVGMATALPMTGWDIGQSFQIVGDPRIDGAHQPSANYQMTSPGYFESLGIPIVRGRSFTEHDNAASVPVCIVNEEFVRKHVKDRNPIGMRVEVHAMKPKGPEMVTREIVGVSRQVKVNGPGENENSAEIYVPLAQNAWYWAVVAIRTDGEPMSVVPALRRAIGTVDKDLPLTRVLKMEEVAAQAVAQPRFRAELVSVFAALAVILATVGVFGVLAFGVSQRTREFGIRMALGAQSTDVLAMVVKQGLRIAAVGVVAGLLAALVLTRSIESLLWGVKPLDPITFLAAPAVLTLIALLACVAPSWRASRVDPAVALRHSD